MVFRHRAVTRQAAHLRTRQIVRDFGARRLNEMSNKLNVAQHIANHESGRAIGLHDRRNDQVGLDKIERIPDLRTLWPVVIYSSPQGGFSVDLMACSTFFRPSC